MPEANYDQGGGGGLLLGTWWMLLFTGFVPPCIHRPDKRIEHLKEELRWARIKEEEVLSQLEACRELIR